MFLFNHFNALFCFLLRLLLRLHLAFAQFREVLHELFNASTYEVHVFVTLLEEYLGHLGALALIAHVYDD